MGALALGFEGNSDELIDLMDSFKETGQVEAYVSLPEPLKQRFFDMKHSKSTGRQYLQNFGNYAREVFGKDFWIDQVLPPTRSAVLDLHYGVDVLVITDLRYPNEADRVHSLGGEVWEVVRPGIESDGHASEQPLPNGLLDYQILNDATLDGLRMRVSQLCTRL